MPIKISRKSHNRLSAYDYSQSNYYYLTICTQNRIKYFDNIENNQIFLNEYGKIINQQWQWLSKKYSYVGLDKFIVMPNHIHGILIINNSTRTGRDLSLRIQNNKIKSLSSLIGAFKTTSAKSIRQKNLPDFKWQWSFYDHIIRNGKSLNEIRGYITNNPSTWNKDENNNTR